MKYISTILESVSGTALADHLKGERSDDEAVSEGSDGENDAALVASTVWDPLWPEEWVWAPLQAE